MLELLPNEQAGKLAQDQILDGSISSKYYLA
jgi:hypothetical protein